MWVRGPAFQPPQLLAQELVRPGRAAEIPGPDRAFDPVSLSVDEMWSDGVQRPERAAEHTENDTMSVTTTIATAS